MLPNPLQTTYYDVHRLIRSICSNFHKRYGGEFDEYLSEAHVMFMDAYFTYDGDSSRFSTWVWHVVTYGLRSYVRNRRRSRRLVSLDHEIIYDPVDPFSVRDFLAGLSDDARECAIAVIDMPMDIKWALKRRKSTDPYYQRRETKTFLREMGWTIKRIQDAFTEVQERLDSYI